jgi:hypothetical protein
MAVQTFTYKKSFGIFFLTGFLGSGKTMDQHMSEMLASGWQIANSANSPGHFSAGKFILTGGVGALLGLAKTKDTITITYIRP